MTTAAAPKTKSGQQTTKLVVRQAATVTPHLIRITAIPANPPEIRRFMDTGHTDSYVKMIFRKDGVRYPEPFDMGQVRAEMPREEWPTLRTYTLRRVDPRTAEVVIDFVYHGDHGLAGPWAANARPGSEMLVVGPGGGYSPDAGADWHLMVGDDAALPAISASLLQIPAGTPVHVVVEVDGPEDHQPLECPGDLRVDWLHRHGYPGELENLLVERVRELEFPAGRVHAFVHGETGSVKLLRRHLLGERGLTPAQLSISGYWRRGYDDESHRALKAAERDQEK